ncbi:polyamine ABC transporter ATP-binding protein, partial [Amaricoccus sp. HAR-UPW-R2A-40]
MGSVTIFEGRVSEDEPEYIRIDCPEIGGTIHVGHGVTCTLDQKVWYAIRPEKMRLTRERPEGAFNLFSAVVEDIGYLGDISVYRLRLPTGKLVSATV